jgi:uncharacterized protein YqjF (DUF2071 family)
MRWLDLLFAHWPVDPGALRPFLPAALELEEFDGTAWLGVVPFVMDDVAPRGAPAFGRFSRFPEVNVRTYVRHRGRSGVWFLSLDAASRLTVLGGRTVFHLPYHHADMSARQRDDMVEYRSRRIEREDRNPVSFSAVYRATGPVLAAEPGSFDAWSTDRKRLFSVDGRGRLWRSEIDHGPWPLEPAEASIDARALAAASGLTLPDHPPILRYSARLDVLGWAPVRA